MLLKKWNICLFVLLLGCSLYGYWNIGYVVERTATPALFLTLSILVLVFFALMRFSIAVKTIFGIGIVFRLLLLFGLPELSQDFYRFLWDGHIQLLGYNPYHLSPNDLIEKIDFPLAQELYTQMGSLSSSHISSYPPLSQWCYQLVIVLGQDSLMLSVVVLRLFLLLFECIVFAFGVLLLKHLQLPATQIGWYFLNPLVIIEAVGNLHGEGMMLGLCLVGCYCILKHRLLWGAVFLSLAISTKLIPLLIIPVFYYYLGWKKILRLAGIIFVFNLLIAWPFFDFNNIENYWTTVYLWFNTFEFNAGIYYIVREIGYEIKGYNIIRRLGKVTPYIVVGCILCFSFFRYNRSAKSLIKSILFILTSYFFMATTVHPWYVISLVLFGLLSGYFFPVLWSVTVFLSYAAYANVDFKEAPIILLVEYLPVYACFFYEVLKKQPLLKHFQKTYFFFRKSSPVTTS